MRNLLRSVDSPSAARRQFLKTGLAGAAMLAIVHRAAAGTLLRSPPRSPQPGSLDLRVLNGATAEFIAALAPVLLAGGLPDDRDARIVAVNEVVEALDRAVAGLSPAVQEEVQQLFTLLTFAPTRALAAGVWTPWSSSSPEDVAGFLVRWRDSRFAPLRSGYQPIKQLMQACWYGNPLAWGKIGYPGAPHVQELGI